MRADLLFFAAAGLAASGLAAAGVAASAPAPASGGKVVLDGKAIFTAQKCDMCHAVTSAEVKATSKIKAPDLSAVTVRDAGVLGQYLRKKAPLGGKPHVKAFMGSDEELGALIAWLQKQAKPAEKK